MPAPELLRYAGTGTALFMTSIYAVDSYRRVRAGYSTALEEEMEQDGIPTSWEEVGTMLGSRKARRE